MSDLDPAVRRRHRRRNLAQAAVLLGGMATMLVLLAGWLFGPAGLVWALLVAVGALAVRPRVPAQWVLSLYGARPLPPDVATTVHHVVAVLARRAGLAEVPAVYRMASPMLNALAVGDRDDAAIAVTDGLLRRLTSRELVGVLAHEICHVRANDLWIMSLSDTVGRITHMLAYTGVFLLVLTAPATFRGTVWPAALALVLTTIPTVVTLLQLALSRSREYDADLEAAALTGDPVGLASALRTLEQHEGRIWERTMVPHRRGPDPLLLRTHPPTEERVARLLELVPGRRWPRLGDSRPVLVDDTGGPDRARLRLPGIWW